ncbi:MAG: nucleotide exchange factor GrpE [Desulfovibrio sp.]|jgi:molecular chaperone GrpE|nr:nucleotide exchange factor GrpE [Desulfovibrio sp.]
MSVKKTVFPPKKKPAAGPPPEDIVLDGFDDLLEDVDRPMPAQPPHPPGQSARGHAAYASAHPGETTGDNLPPFEPRAFSNPLEGIFAQDETEADGHTHPEKAEVLSDEFLAEQCRMLICPSCPAKKEAEEIRLRALAELDNTRKRLQRERDEQVRYAAETVLNAIIPSLDNLDLALQHAADSPACRDFVQGVRMTRKLMRDALSAQGLEEIGQVGEEFNPAHHEAVGTVYAPDIPEGCVCTLLTAGYKLHDRLLRPARVMVCKKP